MTCNITTNFLCNTFTCGLKLGLVSVYYIYYSNPFGLPLMIRHWDMKLWQTIEAVSAFDHKFDVVANLTQANGECIQTLRKYHVIM